MTTLIPGLDSISGALAAEKLRLELVTENIANANTTKGPDGKPFRRKVAVFESYLPKTEAMGEKNMPTVHVKSIVEDKTPGAKVYDPSHPHADASGMVEMPNVQHSREMVDMIAASHAYNAQLKVFKMNRTIAQETLQIGK